MVFTTMRHAASLRSSNNCKCLIETFFIARVKSPLHKRLNPCGLFSAAPLLENGGFNQILPFLGGRSDAACRVVIFLCAIPIYAHMGANDGRWQSPATMSPQMPTVGAGSSQREDSPAHRNIRIPCHPRKPRFLSRRGTPRRYGLRIIASA